MERNAHTMRTTALASTSVKVRLRDMRSNSSPPCGINLHHGCTPHLHELHHQKKSLHRNELYKNNMLAPIQKAKVSQPPGRQMGFS